MLPSHEIGKLQIKLNLGKVTNKLQTGVQDMLILKELLDIPGDMLNMQVDIIIWILRYSGLDM